MSQLKEISDLWRQDGGEFAARAWPIDVEDNFLVFVCDSEQTVSDLLNGGAFHFINGLSSRVDGLPNELEARFLPPGEAIPPLAALLIDRTPEAEDRS